MSEIRPDKFDGIDSSEILRNAFRAVQRFDQVEAETLLTIGQLDEQLREFVEIADSRLPRRDRKAAKRMVTEIRARQRELRNGLESQRRLIVPLQADLNVYRDEVGFADIGGA